MSTDEASDEALVALALRGDGRAAFGRLVLKHQGLVRARLRRLTGGDPIWADDLAQETFLQAWKRLGQFRGDARFATWLHRIAYTTFLQGARSRKIEVEYRFDDTALEGDEAGRQALRLDLDRAFKQLNDGERAALILFYHLDLSLEEVAYFEGLPAETAKTRIARGKAKLRDLLGAWKPAGAK